MSMLGASRPAEKSCFSQDTELYQYCLCREELSRNVFRNLHLVLIVFCFTAVSAAQAQGGRSSTEPEGVRERRELGMYVPRPFTGSLDPYIKRAKAGDVETQYVLGFMYTEGWGVEQDLEKGFAWYELAAKQGHDKALKEVGNARLLGRGTRASPISAHDAWMEAAEKGNREAMRNLAVYFQAGYAGTKDFKESAKWRLKSAELGLPISQYEIAMMYLQGQGVDRNVDEAVRWLQKAAEGGNATAMYRLALLHQSGLGVELDYSKSIELLREAANRGVVPAISVLGKMYEQGKGVPVDTERARKYYLSGAKKGDLKAVVYLGQLYELGSGVDQDYRKARKYYKMAAKGGDISANVRLALMDLRGAGMEKPDKKSGMDLLEDAAKEGDLSAQKVLGQIYWKAMYGVKQDTDRATHWLSKAADQGDAKSAYLVGEIYLSLPGPSRNETAAEQWFKTGDRLSGKKLEEEPASAGAPK